MCPLQECLSQTIGPKTFQRTRPLPVEHCFTRDVDREQICKASKGNTGDQNPPAAEASLLTQSFT